MQARVLADYRVCVVNCGSGKVFKIWQLSCRCLSSSLFYPFSYSSSLCLPSVLAILLYTSPSVSPSFPVPPFLYLHLCLPLSAILLCFFTLTACSFCPSPRSVFALRCGPPTPAPSRLHCLHFLRGLLSSMRMLCVALWHACLDSATSCSTCLPLSPSPYPSPSVCVCVCVCEWECARVINGFYLFKALQCTALQFCRAKGKTTTTNNEKKKEKS